MLRTKIIISAGDQTAKGFSSVNKRIESIDSRLGSATRKMTAMFGVASAGVALTGLIKASDSIKSIDSQLRLATDSQAAFAAASDFVLSTSIATGSTLKNNADLYATLSRSSGDLHGNQDKLEKVQTTLNKSFAIGNRSAIETNAATRQLTQGLASGVLRGDEFNSVMENAPRLQRILRDGLSKTTGELREMAEEGEITAEKVIAAIIGQSEVIEQEFDSLELTIGRTWTAASQAALEYVGSADSVSASNTVIAHGLQGIAENFATVAKFGEAAAVVMVARYAGKGITAIQGHLVKQYELITAEKAKQVATTKTLQTEVAASAATVNRARTELQLSQAMARSATGSNLATLAETRLLAARRGLTAATQQASASNAAYAASTARVTLAGGALKGVMGLLGGPAGVIALGAITLGSWALSSSSAADETEGLTTRIDQLTGSMQNLRAVEIQKTMDEVADKITKAKEKLASTPGPVSDREIANITRWGLEWGKLEVALGKVNKEYAATVPEVQGLTAEEEKLTASLQAQADTITKGVQTSYEKYVLALGKTNNLEAQGFLNTEAARRSRKALSKAYQDSIKPAEKATTALEKYGESLVGLQKEEDILIDKHFLLDELFLDGAISAEVYDAALRDLGVTTEEVGEKTGVVVSQMDKIWGNFTENTQSAFGDLFYNGFKEILDDGEDAFEVFGDTLIDMAIRTAAEIAAAFALNGIIGLATGQGTSGFSFSGGGQQSAGQQGTNAVVNAGISAGIKKGFTAVGEKYFAAQSSTGSGFSYAGSQSGSYAGGATNAEYTKLIAGKTGGVSAGGSYAGGATNAQYTKLIAGKTGGTSGTAATGVSGATALGIAGVVLATWVAVGKARDNKKAKEANDILTKSNTLLQTNALNFGVYGKKAGVAFNLASKGSRFFAEAMRGVNVEVKAGANSTFLLKGELEAAQAVAAAWSAEAADGMARQVQALNAVSNAISDPQDRMEALAGNVKTVTTQFTDAALAAAGLSRTVSTIRDVSVTIDKGKDGTSGTVTTSPGAPPSPGSPPPFESQNALGGMINGPEVALVGEAGRELILPNNVTEFFVKNGVPINTGGGGGSTKHLESIIEKLIDAVVRTGGDQTSAINANTRNRSELIREAEALVAMDEMSHAA